MKPARIATASLLVAALGVTACGAPANQASDIGETTAAMDATSRYGLGENVIESTLYTSIEQKLFDSVPHLLDWTRQPGVDWMTIRRTSALAYHVHLELRVGIDPTRDAQVQGDFDIQAAICNWRAASVALEIANVRYQMQGGSALTANQRDLVRQLFDVEASYGRTAWRSIASALSHELSKMLAENHIDADQCIYCPIVDIDAANNLILDFRPGSQCPNDEATKHAVCKSPAKGKGDDYVCRNGYWIWASHDCVKPQPSEPTPPGGAQL